MSETYFENYAMILLFFAAAILFSIFGILTSRLLSVSKPNVEKLKSYESGEEPSNDARIQYNPGYFVIALIFLLFEVEILFLFPWALIFDNTALNNASEGLWSYLTLIEMFIFIAILLLGLFFVWKKGFLDWPKAKIEKEEYQSNIPDSFYEDINKKYT